MRARGEKFDGNIPQTCFRTTKFMSERHSSAIFLVPIIHLELYITCLGEESCEYICILHLDLYSSILSTI